MFVGFFEYGNDTAYLEADTAQALLEAIGLATDSPHYTSTLSGLNLNNVVDYAPDLLCPDCGREVTYSLTNVLIAIPTYRT